MAPTIAAGCSVVLLAASCASAKPMPLTAGRQAAVTEADPQMQAVLDQLQDDGGRSFSQGTVEQARSGATAQLAAVEVAKAENLNVPETVGGISDMSMTGRDGNNFTLKTYAPIWVTACSRSSSNTTTTVRRWPTSRRLPA